MRIHFINSLKTSIAVAASIIIAELLGLQFAISAAIVAILTIAPTKKETVSIAIKRLLAYISALFIAFVIFKIGGINNISFTIYVFLYAMICHMNKWQAALAMNSVLIGHFLSFGAMGPKEVVNEIGIFAVGVGIGIIANLTLHKDADSIAALKNQSSDAMAHILDRMAERIQKNDLEDYDGICLVKLDRLLADAEAVAEENNKNTFKSGPDQDMIFIESRKKQYYLLVEMYKDVKDLKTTPQTSTAIIDYISAVSDSLRMKGSGREYLLSRFAELDQELKKKPLPVTRQEFEDRARLYSFMRSLEEFSSLCVHS